VGCQPFCIEGNQLFEAYLMLNLNEINMKTSTLSPEANHAVHFREFIQQFAQKFEPLQIFSFSKITCTQNSQGCFIDTPNNLRCDYCLLVITEAGTRIDYGLQDFANNYYRNGSITIICHTKQSVVEAVQQNHRFFISVLTFGILHYSSDGLVGDNAIPLFIPTKGAVKAKQHYDQIIPLADGFLMCASECLENAQFRLCVFMLHQAVEQASICLIRVQMAYRSDFHNLYRLLRLCQCFSGKPLNHFLSTPEDERLFSVMAKSYSDSRYKDDFTVARQDAEHLYQKVASYLLLSKIMCNDKIAILDQEAAVYILQNKTDTAKMEINSIYA
jgi:HEPN domain-containing protein